MGGWRRYVQSKCNCGFLKFFPKNNRKFLHSIRAETLPGTIDYQVWKQVLSTQVWSAFKKQFWSYSLQKNIYYSIIYSETSCQATLNSPILSLISVNCDLVHDFLCKLILGRTHFFIWSKKTLFEKKKMEKFWCKQRQIP